MDKLVELQRKIEKIINKYLSEYVDENKCIDHIDIEYDLYCMESLFSKTKDTYTKVLEYLVLPIIDNKEVVYGFFVTDSDILSITVQNFKTDKRITCDCDINNIVIYCTSSDCIMYEHTTEEIENLLKTYSKWLEESDG